MSLNGRHDNKDIYLIPICGTAMASLAALLRRLGCRVRGADQGVYPPMSIFLQEQGIEIYEGYDVTHLQPQPDLVIIGNALSRGNPEVEEILERKLRYASLPEALKEFFLRDRYSLVITGTHGKTTTSAMIAWALECDGQDPSYLIGGILNNFEGGSKLGGGVHFVIEGDEYDTAFFDKGPKFMHYLPDVAVINNIEFDHADIYHSIDEIKIAFRRFINIIPRNGLLVAGGDDLLTVELAARAFCPVHSFGIDRDSDWMAKRIRCSPEGTRFGVAFRGGDEGEYAMPLIGAHNVRNALATIAVCRFLGISNHIIRDALATFRGVKKRLELRAEIAGVTLYDDFAHHPTAIAETLRGLRNAHPERQVWGVYEPRTATARRSVFQRQLVSAFADADHVIVAPVHRPDKVGGDALFSVEKLVKDLRANGIDALALQGVDEIVLYLSERVREGDLVVTLSNGDFNDIHNKLKNAIERKTHNGEQRRKLQKRQNKAGKIGG